MGYRDLLTLLGIVVLGGFVGGPLNGQAFGADAPRPNVVLVMCDDLGWGDVGFNGNRVIKTPNLDRMAANALKFDRFYAAAPVCSPTRGSCLTGRHPYRYGVTFANRGHLKAEEITLAEVLRPAGYRTGMFGKWHLGTLTTRVKDANRGGPGSEAIFAPPWQNGFDTCFCTESKVPTYDPLRVPAAFPGGGNRHIGWDALMGDEPSQAYGTRYWNEQGEVVDENVDGDDSRVIMDRALPFMEQACRAGEPFLAVIWFHAPHLPVVAGPRHREAYSEFDVHRRNYYGCVTALDEQMGRLRSKLREWDVADSTMVWFCSDNGPEGGPRDPGSAGPFRGRKRSLYEGGVRVPALLEWPARIRQARSTRVPAVTSDYLPTILDALDLPLPDADRPLDGISLLPLIEAPMTEGPAFERTAPIGFRSGQMTTWSGNRYKLVVRGKGGGSGKGSATELYDLIDDPSESRDLAAEHPGIVDRMRREVAAWVASCDASAKGDDYQ